MLITPKLNHLSLYHAYFIESNVFPAIGSFSSFLSNACLRHIIIILSIYCCLKSSKNVQIIHFIRTIKSFVSEKWHVEKVTYFTYPEEFFRYFIAVCQSRKVTIKKNWMKSIYVVDWMYLYNNKPDWIIRLQNYTL